MVQGKLFETTIDTSLFEEFWKKYPRKVAKKKALKAWDKINPDRKLLDKMLSSIEIAKKSRAWIEGFIPHPATYLNGERWEDEIDESEIINESGQQNLQEVFN